MIEKSSPGFGKCLTTLPEPFYSLESGLRMRICFSEISPVRKLRRQWENLSGESRPEGPIQTFTVSSVKKQLAAKEVLFFYDGNGRNAGEKLAELHRDAAHSVLASRFVRDPHRDRILSSNKDVRLSPRRFPNAIFSVILTGTELILLFPSDYRERLHLVSLPLSEEKVRRLDESLKKFFYRLHETPEPLTGVHSAIEGSAALESLPHIAPETALAEIFNRKQVEFTCPEPGWHHFELNTDNAIYDRTMPCDKDSVFLLKRNPERVIDYLQHGDLRIDVPFLEEARSLVWRASSDNHEKPGYWSLIPCHRFCHHLGVDLKTRESAQRCKLQDIQLTEWNPAGVLQPGQQTEMDSGGKFLELSVQRRCNAQSLRLEISDHSVLFSGTVLDKGIYLLVADASLFLDSDVTLQSHHSLRNLTPEDRLRILDLRDGRSKRLATNPGDYTVLRGSTDRESPAMGNHSFQGSDGLLHPPSCRGLLPDLCRGNLNAMSPGFEVEDKALPRVALDEMLPAGAQEPDQEFLEFKTSVRKEEINYTAGYLRIRMDATRSYDFILGLPRASERRFAIMRSSPQCPAGPVLRASELRIPNEPFRLRIQARIRSRNRIRTLDLLDRQFGPGFQSTEHSHLVGRTQSDATIGSGDWMIHAEGGCHNSSPGKPGHYRPKFLIRGKDSLRLLWKSDQPALFRWSSGSDLADSSYLSPGANPLWLPLGDTGGQTSFTISVQHLESKAGERLRSGGPNIAAGQPGQTIRKARVWPATGPNSSCVVETLHAAEPEWLRLCFPDGTTSNLKLKLQDEYSQDNLVSAEKRNSELQSSEASQGYLQRQACALILDPDMQPREILSVDEERDQLWLMPETGSALGNGLRTDESITVRAGQSEAVLCTYREGLPADEYPVTGPAERVYRKGGTYQDSPENFAKVGE
ncbi:MAG: hypothetical protein CMN76_08190 [Spirochaetaceae bacterium]|nr:hypothetical protein [Spirochaetaceae bacterium]|tara:strand:+ start:48704 stop:51469 length:2766 start_codon:yes stop_codon:yes gene_type:complete